jgi:hypothetical protein
MNYNCIKAISKLFVQLLTPPLKNIAYILEDYKTLYLQSGLDQFESLKKMNIVNHKNGAFFVFTACSESL